MLRFLPFERRRFADPRQSAGQQRHEHERSHDPDAAILFDSQDGCISGYSTLNERAIVRILRNHFQYLS